MPRLTQLAMAATLLGIASAQSQSQSQSALVTSIFFPLADPQPLDASIIAQSSGATTIAMNCAPDTPFEDCGFPEPITLTVGPSTLHHIPSGIYEVLGDIDCKITASTVADCTATAGLYTEAADESGTGNGHITTAAASSSTTRDILSGTDVSWLPITITAGLEKAASASATTTSTATSGIFSDTSHSTSLSGTRTSTSSAEAASATVNVAAGNSRVAYAGLGVAAVLVAGSMVLL